MNTHDNQHEHDYRIQSPELAHHMGYGEYPYRELAAISLKQGLDAEHEEYLSDASDAGVRAGREFIRSLETQIKDNLEMAPHAQEHKLMQGVRIDALEFQAFAKSYTQERSEASGKNVANLGNKAWRALHNRFNDGSKDEDLSEGIDLIAIDKLVSSIDSVASRFYDKTDYRYPKEKKRAVEGAFYYEHNFGVSTYDYIEKFVYEKRQQLLEEASKSEV